MVPSVLSWRAPNTMNDAIDYRPLSTAFSRDHYHFTQLARGQRSAVYLQVHETKRDVERPHFEVIKIRRASEHIMPDGAVLPPREVYPSGNDWGLRGWTHCERQDAMTHFRDLESREEPERA